MPENIPAFTASEYILPLSKEPASGALTDKDEYSLKNFKLVVPCIVIQCE